MARERYDSEWKEVKDINGRVLLLAYASFAFKGLGILVVTWTTVVLLGGFVSMIDKQDFWNLTLITLTELLWIDSSFLEKIVPARDLLISSLKAVINLLTGAYAARHDHPDLPLVKRVVAAVRMTIVLVHSVILCCCIVSVISFLVYGLYITTCISISGLMERHHYGEADEDRINMDPSHDVLYVLCLAQGAMYLYRLILSLWMSMIVNQVSQAYGFQDGDRTVSAYSLEIFKGCKDNLSSVRERNLITYAVELMESTSALSDSFLSGTLILDTLLMRQHSDRITKPPNLIDQEEEKEQQQLDLGEGAPLIKKENREENNKKSQHQQTERKIIGQQRKMIKRLIGSASSAHILQKLLQMLESTFSYDRKMREAAARIVEHVADGIFLEQFPQGIECISSLINTFEATTMTRPSSSNTRNDQEKEQDNTLSSDSENSESESESELDSNNNVDIPSLTKVLLAFKDEVLSTPRGLWRLVTNKDNNTVPTISTSKSKSDNDMDPPSASEANWDKPNPFHDYKELVLTGLRILWTLAGNADNCRIICNTEHLVSKIMAPTSYDLMHRGGHSEWSTKVSQTSLGVMLQLILTAKGDTRANLRQQVTSDEGAITTMERIVTCEGCKGGELQMKAMQILAQLCMDETANRGNLTKMLVSIFTNGDSGDGSIRKAAGKTLAALLRSCKSVTTLLPKEENDKFICDLAQILIQVGENDTFKRSATEILDYLCIHYTKNEQYLSTLKNAMTCVMPKVLREILSGLTGEEGNPCYAWSSIDVESQVTNNNDKNNNHTSFSPRQNKHHKLHVAQLSLCATACDKLHLDLDTISLGGGDQGECVVFSIAMKMVQLNRDIITADNLKVMKLITRMVIAAMKKFTDHDTVVEWADLESLMDSLSSISGTMLDLEGSMVFATGTTATVPATADTLDYLVKQARKLHSEIMDQES